MVIHKIVNNNLIITKSKKGTDVILKGKGIGFQKKPGDVVNDELIEQKFVLENEET
ncbi:MAG: transcription antiterminator BglG, partial [Erysipelotrichaceae bacterium]|nr:transcription antiterminator BglG [Erysipelotrichaceae bacterium]